MSVLYGLEAVSSYNYQLRLLDFVINKFCMKLFITTDIQVVAECQAYFGFNLPSVELPTRTTTFWTVKIVIGLRHSVVSLFEFI